jgi:hypothetical protein
MSRRELEKLARTAEEAARREDSPLNPVYFEGQAQAFRKVLELQAPSFIGVYLEIREKGTRFTPIGLRPEQVQTEAYWAIERFCGQPISTSFTIEWDGMVLRPSERLSHFGIEEGDTLKVINAGAWNWSTCGDRLWIPAATPTPA